MTLSSPPPAVVVGLDCITGLQTARILTRRGVPVVAVAKDIRHFCCRTKVCQRIVSADTAGEELIERLEDMGPELDAKGVLFPCTDLSVLMCARHRHRLERWYHVDTPPVDVLETLMDKVRCHHLAVRHGVPVPAAFFLASRGDVQHAAGQVRYPCVLKPPLKTPLWEQHARKAYKIHSAAELLETYDRCCDYAETLMVQEWIDGSESDLFSCYCYYNAHAQPLATFVARKLRQWPAETGTSSLGVECRNDEVLRATLRLFDSVGFQGLGYVEMKHDRRTGGHYLVEPNVGRPTGRSAIVEAGGVEMLYTKYCDNLGWPLPEQRTQQFRDTKWIHWRRDLQAALWRWRRGELTLRQWWRSTKGPKCRAVFDGSDWGPFLAEMRFVVGRFFRSKRYANEE